MRVQKVPTGGSIRQYKLYVLNGAGHFAGPPHPFDAATDEAAMKVAEAWRGGRNVELWCGTRRIELKGPTS